MILILEKIKSKIRRFLLPKKEIGLDEAREIVKKQLKSSAFPLKYGEAEENYLKECMVR